MVVCSNLCLLGDQCWCSAWSWVRIFYFLDGNGDVVHGRGFESLIFGGQWRCSTWSCGRISDFWGVNGGGVVHGGGFRVFDFGGSMVASA
jgi:hypothetical protein